MFVVAGASGNTGKVAAETLLAQGKEVRVLVRSEAAAAPWRRRATEVALAGLDDVDALTSALRGAEGAYLLLPPQMDSTQPRADNARRSQGYVKAIEASGVEHVVFLSSIGAQLVEGSGPILAVHDAEAGLTASRADATFLRAAYFMENWGGSLYGLAQGTLPGFLAADAAIPMVATLDIGTTAARLLVEGGRGKRAVQLSGPREYSPRDVATALGRITGKPVELQVGPIEAMAGALQGAGLNAAWAGLYQEMARGLNEGRVIWEQGQAQVRGTTDIEAVLRRLLSA
ncbi:MAG TPA: NAD(P)H-binding protein [Polyangiaceae bacterium]|jgi:uncharacterized protein YbjT (DUF2867 family)